MRNISKKSKAYIISVAAALAVGVLSALFTMGNMDVYQKINKPPLSPPSFLFPVIWAILYILMGISVAMVYLSNRPGKSSALLTYGISLAVNFFWSIIFFNMEAYTFAFIWLVFLLMLIIYTIKQYRSISPAAAYLQIPYLLWVAFAGYLNFVIAILN